MRPSTMKSMNDYINEYTNQLKKGHIQKAYKGILSFMSGLKTYLEKRHTDYTSGALYFGYMDMTYFAFTPVALKEKSLKIGVVYLHEENRFEVWLAGSNRRIQAEYPGSAFLGQRVRETSHDAAGRSKGPGIAAFLPG